MLWAVGRRTAGRKQRRQPSGLPVGHEIDPQASELQPTPVPEPARNLELERSIIDHWDDDGVWSVYADWLLAQGDPHGELLGLELALEACTNRAQRGRLEQARRQLCARHVRSFGEWFVGEGPIEVEPGVLLGMRRGFIERAYFSSAGPSRGRPKRLSLRQAIETFVSHSSARFLRELELDGASWTEVCATLAALGPRASLRSISSDYPWMAIELRPLLAFAPEVRTLAARVEELVIEPNLTLPQLETLSLELLGRRLTCIEHLACLVGLRTLHLRFAEAWDARELGPAALERLAASKGLPALERLRLHVEYPELLAALARLPLLARLRTLELTLGRRQSAVQWLEHVVAIAEHLASLERVELQLDPFIDVPVGFAERLHRVLPNASLIETRRTRARAVSPARAAK
jgi:uncharacterized protein (TIGR02996 family)